MKFLAAKLIFEYMLTIRIKARVFAKRDPFALQKHSIFYQSINRAPFEPANKFIRGNINAWLDDVCLRTGKYDVGGEPESVEKRATGFVFRRLGFAIRVGEYDRVLLPVKYWLGSGKGCEKDRKSVV